MRSSRNRFLGLLTLLPLSLPTGAWAALHQEGASLPISTETQCSFLSDLSVISTPKGAFDVLWVEDRVDEVVKSQRFARNLAPSPPVDVMPLHGGLDVFDLQGAWAGRYEWVLNVLDFGEDPDDPWATYRVQIDAEGHPLAAPRRIEIRDIFRLFPAAGGDSLRLRFEPPYFGPTTCQSAGFLATRVDRNGAPISPESRVTRKAPSWGGFLWGAQRLSNDGFLVAYSTCEKFFGVVTRRLSPTGVPLGKPITLQLPARAGNLLLAARGPADFAVVSGINNGASSLTGTYVHGVVNGQTFGPGYSGTFAWDLAAGSNGYLLVFWATRGNAPSPTFFAQQLDLQGRPVGAPVQVSPETAEGRGGAVASLPDNRWIVVTRWQNGQEEACRENIVGTILSSE
jgi:hypothetical protein